MTVTDNSTHSLYRHFDEKGTLLYIGISLSAINRLSQHKNSEWFDEIAKVEIEKYPDRNAALLAEREAIKAEKPLHNVVHSENVKPEKKTKLPRTDLGKRILQFLHTIPEGFVVSEFDIRMAVNIDAYEYFNELTRQDRMKYDGYENSQSAFDSAVMKLAYMKFIYPIDWIWKSPVVAGYYGKYFPKYRLNKYGRRVVEEMSGTEEMPIYPDFGMYAEYSHAECRQMNQQRTKEKVSIPCSTTTKNGKSREYLIFRDRWKFKSEIRGRYERPTGYISDEFNLFFNPENHYKPAFMKSAPVGKSKLSKAEKLKRSQ